MKVLLIDADSATNGLTLLFLKEIRINAELVRSKARSPVGLFDAFLNQNVVLDQCDRVELSECLHLIPASYGLQSVTPTFIEIVQQFFESILTPLRNEYDFILIDAQAGIDDMAQVAMSRKVSDEVVIVSEYDPMSAAGVERLKAMLREDLTYDRTWVLLNKLLPEFAKSVGDFLEVAKYLSPIPWDAEVVRAYARRRLAIDTDTGTEHTLCILQTLKGLCGESIQAQLDDWILSKAAIIRQPIELQYLDAEKELAFLFARKAELSQRRRRRFLVSVSLAISALVAMIIGITLNYTGVKSGVINEILPLALAVLISAIVAVGFGIDMPRFLQAMLEPGRIQGQLDEARFDRQLELLKDRLKRLELLRTLDPERLLQHRNNQP
jgi:cellulose biosynthesis protein BcsQ